MAISLEALLENLEEVLEEGVNLPFSGGKRMVDVDAARDIIDDIRLNLPQEILQARAIVQDRAQILSSAKKEAETMVKTAEERARVLLDREEIVRQAEAKAKTITSEANQQAVRLRNTVTKYCDNMLASSQEQLQKSVSEMQGQLQKSVNEMQGQLRKSFNEMQGQLQGSFNEMKAVRDSLKK